MITIEPMALKLKLVSRNHPADSEPRTCTICGRSVPAHGGRMVKNARPGHGPTPVPTFACGGCAAKVQQSWDNFNTLRWLILIPALILIGVIQCSKQSSRSRPQRPTTTVPYNSEPVPNIMRDGIRH